jgi:lipopolysaccharide biosynthesis glycosyltransferase
MSNEIQNLFRPCSANRLIIPAQLHDVSRFIYVDTDVIWLEDPAIVFQEFSKFDESQELGFAYEIENDAVDETSFYHAVKYPLPIFGPNGVNAGVAFFRVKDPKRTCDEFLEIALKYKSQMGLGDQDVLNFYGSSHPEKIFRLECQYNRRTDSKCTIYTKGILHGNRHVFHSDMVKPFNEYPLRFNLVKSIPVHGLDDGLLG